jgi:hypothetical protein
MAVAVTHVGSLASLFFLPCSFLIDVEEIITITKAGLNSSIPLVTGGTFMTGVQDRTLKTTCGNRLSRPI